MQGFNFVTPIEVRFRDLDSLGHVNNAVLITYLETARVKYLLSLVERESLQDLNIILAEVTCSYRSPAYYGESLETGVRITEIGNKSFVMEYRIEERETRRTVVTASSIQVAYDYETQQSIPVPARFVERAEVLEDRSLRKSK
ncbi:MAG: 1,4-dihydroxy-2-naphthoyl-CoA hydrolase [Anaerolineales bacterium]|nr:1,4-dihydroxy-2-naphthoyl-CoA hydrolase [Anaerolineales bacterium]